MKGKEYFKPIILDLIPPGDDEDDPIIDIPESGMDYLDNDGPSLIDGG